MPIYEFYCGRCNTIYNFFSQSVNTSKIPVCPKCKNVRLTRQMSVFAKISGGEKAEDDHSFAGMDEKKMEKELVKFASLAEKVKDDDPRTAAQLMRKFTEMTGMKLGDNFQEALQRIEKGEDPEKIEDEMGDILTQEGALSEKQAMKTAANSKPKIDGTLYEL
jgi:putative FmdB family regulatory protein